MIEALSSCILKIEQGAKTSNQSDVRKMGERLLASLAPILAGAEVGNNKLGDLEDFEQLVRGAALADSGPFGTFWEDWQLFRADSERSLLSAMTVNERLFALGLLENFDQGAQAGDWSECQRILQRAFVDEPDVEAIISECRSQRGGDGPDAVLR